MDIKDYSNYKEGIFVYGGKAGPKKSVYDENNVWMLKFPQNTKSKEQLLFLILPVLFQSI